ncbi:glycoside hydrolase family 15 protein [uncultured Bacteroides sp.]|uniref:glycoside hydrolase family 15 protein n=1 Tax=uncultured Bacteroides sp. TaxID=162156 RepID=UPI002AAC4A11|nr:glycoside hydrolase family 15 protein [uncultured Bacteroides sp.]
MRTLDYGVIGNCRTAALISKTGQIDWLCFPDFDSPSIFGELLDEKNGGSFGIEVSDDYRISQSYIRSTNILQTKYESDTAAFELLDFMPRYKTGETTHYTPPEVYRLIRILYGSPKIRIKYVPAMNYAADVTVNLQVNNEFIRTNSSNNHKDTMYLYSNLSLQSIIQYQEITLVEDSFLLLSYYQKLIPIDITRVNLEYQRTKVYWLNWSNRSRKFGDYNKEITRSMLILKLMSYHRTGAVLAALTTSLPEAIGETRNWDYRFCWVRDASMSIKTLLKLNHSGAALRFINFIKYILKSKNDSLQIMYGIRGERVLTETTLTHLAGYENSVPVRVGNDAYIQKQNDSLGYLMDVIYQYFLNFPGSLDEAEEMFEVVKIITKDVIENWRKPDKSIWEIRGEEKHFVFSKVMCWVALDRGIEIARLLNRDYFVGRWSEEAKLIKENVFMYGWKEDIQSFTQTYDNNYMDSSLLLMEAYGFIDSEDEKYRKTVARIKQDLFYNDLMYRYKNEDDFGKPTSAFTICTFWLVRALYVTGEKKEAQRIFNQLCSYANHVGLMSEDLDFITKRQLGNFPQAYSHLAMIDIGILLSEEKTQSHFIRP